MIIINTINKILNESWQLFKDILSDTLQNKNKWSSKKFMSFVAFNTVVAMAWLEMISKQEYKTNIEIILMLLGIAGYSSALTIYSNQSKDKH